MNAITFRLLGAPTASIDSTLITKFGTGKAKALLAWLLMESERVHARATLAGLLWPDSAENKAAMNLRQTLHRLRKPLPKDLLIITNKTVRINPDYPWNSDVRQVIEAIEATRIHRHHARHSCRACIEKLNIVAELYQAEFLDGLFFSECIALEEWIVFNREWLRRQALVALADLTRFHAARSHFAKAEQFARQLLKFDPLQESTQRQLIRVLAASGDRTTALEQFTHFESLLHRELGVSPTRETLALMEEIRLNRPQSPNPSPALPVVETPFFGRIDETTHLHRLLAEPTIRLVTITGMGGIGKTRLALHVAETTNETSCFVPLADLQCEPEAVANRIALLTADHLSLSIIPNGDAEQQLLDRLDDRQLLLIYDNLEHLPLREVREFFGRLQTACRGITILATSRERLRSPGEQLFVLNGLEVPEDSMELTDVRHLQLRVRYPALQLFEEHARRMDPAFELNIDNLQAVSRICRLVRGMPLALELAAGWVEHFTTEEIAESVETDADFLTAHHATNARHTGMRAVFDYSWRLLTPEQRSLLARLSIFSGMFDRRAALQIANARLHHLVALVDKSLVQVVDKGRYLLHPLIREYSAEQFRQLDSAEQTNHDTRFAEYYLCRIATIEPKLFGRTPLAILNTLLPDLNQIREAWQRACDLQLSALIYKTLPAFTRLFDLLGRSHELADHLELAANATGNGSGTRPIHAAVQLAWANYAGVRGEFATQAALLDSLQQTIESTNDPTLQSAWHTQKAYVLQEDGHGKAATEQFKIALQIAEQTGDKRLIARPLSHLTWFLTGTGQHSERALQLTREVGDLWMEARMLNMVGISRANGGRYEGAAQCFQELLDIPIWLSHDHHRRMSVHGNLARVLMLLGDDEAARTNYERTLELAELFNDDRGRMTGYSGLSGILRRNGSETKEASLELAQMAYQLTLKTAGQADIVLSLISLGESQLACGKLDDAEATFQYSRQRLDGLDAPIFTSLSGAGLIGTYLQRGMSRKAHTLAVAIWEDLKLEGVNPTLGPFTIYNRLIVALATANDPLAMEAAKAARALQQQFASHIRSMSLREKFLHCYSLHQVEFH